jgi:glycosyltransferase involved in cell wall biosynthesis
MPSVVHIDTSRTWRGGQLQVFLLHRELIRLGVGSRLLARKGGALHLRCEEAEVPVEPVPFLRLWHPPAVFAVWRRTLRSQIVHAHDSHAVALAAVARSVNPRLAVVCHRRIAYPPTSALFNRWKHRHVDRWIAVSTEIAQVLHRVGVDELRIVPSAVDIEDLQQQATDNEADRLRSEFGIGAGSPVVGLVGALAPQKGHEALIAAAPSILAAAPDTVFLCVGEGQLRGRLQRRVRRRGIGGAFRFTGFRRDVPSLMGLCTVIAAPSLDGEGSSAVIKEAMMLGTPVVASDLPGNIEVLDGAGVAIPVADAATLAGAVVTMLEDSNRRAAFGAVDLKRCEQWLPSTMAAGVLGAYDGLGQSVSLASEAI